MTIDTALAKLANVRRCGKGWSARCPAHDDRDNSLSVGLSDDGKILLNCFVGCSVKEIVASLGLTVRDLFAATSSPRRMSDVGNITTVEDLARDKALPLEFLRSLGLENRADGVLIPYARPNGSLAPRHRLRTSLVAKHGSLWVFGDGKPVPYGLDRLGQARDAGYLVVVEGESDCWTGWHHGVPTLGIPGASMTSTIEAEHIDGIGKIFVVKEPDAGGDQFVHGMARRLGALRWSGELRIVHLNKAGDLNALHKSGAGDFKIALQQALEDARAESVVSPTTDTPTTPSIEVILTQSGLARLETGAPTNAIEGALRELGDHAVDCDPLRQTLMRNAAIGHLKKIGVGSPARLVDAALTGIHLDGRRDDPGNPRIILREVEPSSESVGGGAVLADIVETIIRHVALDRAAAAACALWVVHTYAINASYVSPILAIISPVKRCGKTTLLSVLTALVTKPLPASNVTPAVVFRTIESYTPTLLVDEADTFIKRNDELRGVLNAGHSRATAQVLRTVGDRHEPQIFSTWCPKAIALIGRLPSTLEDRSIVVSMRRRASGESVKRLRVERVDVELESLRSRVARWTLDNEEPLRESDPDVPEQLHDRAQDNWRSLLAIADLAGGEWPQRAREAAIALAGAIDEEEQTAGVQLLVDLRDLYRDKGTDRLVSKEIVEALTKMEDRPWPEWRMGKPLSQRQLAKLLKPFGVRPKTIRTAAGTAKGYLVADMVDAFGRYLPPEPSQRNNGDIPKDSGESEPSQVRACDGWRNREKGQDGELVTVVTDREEGAEGSEASGQEDPPGNPERESFDL